MLDLRVSSILDSYSGKRVLMTGGLGFIGSTLARRFVAAGAAVTVVDSLIPKYGGNLFNIAGLESCLCVSRADIRDEAAIASLVRQQDILYNLAGQTSHIDSMCDPITDLDINCRAQLTTLEACRRSNPAVPIVFASTRQIYGKPGYLPVDEKHPLAPCDVNGINKMAGEWYHILYHRVYGMTTCVLRLTNTYGPRMRIKDARQTFLGLWIRLVLEGKPFEIWGGDQLRDFTYVDDAVDALILCAGSEKSAGQIYNLGGCETVTLRELAELLVEVNGGGYSCVRDFPSDRKPIDIGDYYADFHSIQDALGWQPSVPLREGLSRTLDYYRTNLAHYL